MSDTSKTVKPENETVASVEDPSSAAVPVVDPRLLVREEGFKGYLTEFKRKVRGGELGSLPVIIGLIIIWTIFQTQSSQFLTAGNLANIGFFLAATGMLAIGLVFVLLLGEIDLSVGSVSGLASALFAIFVTKHGMNPWLALVLTILTGVLIGSLHGWFFAKIGVPAFVVTLAGFLGWNGLMLQLLGDSGSLSIPDNGPLHILGQRSFFMDQDVVSAYLLAGLGTVAMLAGSLIDQRRRRAAEVPYRPSSEIALRVGALAVVTFVAAYVLNQASGVPNALVVFLAALVITDFVLRRTSYGRKVFAVGGGIEAARRAGINVALVRISVFAIAAWFRGARRHVLRRPDLHGDAGRRWRQRPDAGHRGRGHRWHQPLRRPRHRLVRAARHAGHPVHPDRSGPAQHEHRTAVHDHRGGPARGCRHRLGVPPEPEGGFYRG